MEKLLATLKNIPEFKQLLASIAKAESAAVTGIGQINRSHMIAALHKEIARPLVIICQDDIAAKRTQEELSAFLGKLTRRISIDRWRKLSADKRGGGSVPAALDELSQCIPGGADPAAQAEAKELARILDVFLQELPIMERRVFVCRYWYLDGISDIARQFNCSQSKIKSMLYRTRKKLLVRLRKEGVFCEI